MVNYSNGALDSIFAALSDPTRRAILARLAHGEASVTALAEPFAMSLPAVSKHLRVLESAGLLRREIDGRVHHCQLVAEPMKDAAAWIQHYRAFWEKQFDALAKYLETTQGEENQAWPHRSKAQDSGSKSGGRSRRRARGSSRRGRSGRN